MKKFLVLYLLTGWLTLSCSAQGGGLPRNGGGGGMLESVHIAYLTRALNLSPFEAQRFWPIYYQYVGEIRQVRMAYKIHHNEIRLDEDILNIKKKYFDAFSRALSPERANQFFRVEKEFGNYVQRELMERRQMNQQRRPMMGGGPDTGRPPSGY